MLKQENYEDGGTQVLSISLNSLTCAIRLPRIYRLETIYVTDREVWVQAITLCLELVPVVLSSWLISVINRRRYDTECAVFPTVS